MKIRTSAGSRWSAAFFCCFAASLLVVKAGPLICLTSPANTATFAAPANVTLSASFSDTAGTVTNVAFYVGATLLANAAGFPATFTTPNLFSGTYALSAVATDDNGLTATSALVSITVTNTMALNVLQQIKTVFVIALENHDLVQANPEGNPQQLLGNPAAPYLNSLMTPGNPNAAQVSYATHYYATGSGEHPSEPNYIWSEGGTEFGSHTDSDPNPAAGNVFTNVMHLSGQLTAAGIPWRSYQEDLEYSPGPAQSAAGSGVPANPYNGTTEYFYAVKHNPMQFFTDTQNQNCYPLTNFWADLTNNNIGRYNWITPDMFNEMHSSLPGGCVYQGVHYTGDQASIAEGDHFLSLVIPQIMASAAYQSNGLIIIWMDETESTDDTNTTLPYIVISPLAKGNAYASTVPYSHSSNLKTMDEIFGLAYQTNTISPYCVNAQNTGYNYVDGRSAPVFDISDLFRIGSASAISPGVLVGGSTNTNSSNLAEPPPGATTIPIITGEQRGASGLQLTFGGPTNQTYEVLATTNLSQPQSAWLVLSTGTFGGTNRVFTDTNTAAYPARYYTVTTP